jgi:modified peptide precursor CbpA
MTTKLYAKDLKQEKREEFSTIAYRLKCSSTGNGLSHYVMYGDMPEESAHEEARN